MNKLEFYLNPKNWVTPSSQEYKVRECWFPLSTAIDSWEKEFHELMLHDRLRMDAYKKAIELCVIRLIKKIPADSEQVIRVMDLGSGSGIWTHLFASHWYKKCPVNRRHLLRIYSIEANKTTYTESLICNIGQLYKERKSIQSDSFSIFCTKNDQKIILLANTNVLDLSFFFLSRKNILRDFDHEMVSLAQDSHSINGVFDAIISECIGGIGDDEGILEILYPTVENWAKDDCIVIPYSVTQQFVPVVVENEDGYLNDKINSIAASYDDRSVKYYDVVIPANDTIGNAKPGKTFSFGKGYKSPSNYDDVDIMFTVSADFANKYFIGMKGYFSAVLIRPEGGELISMDLGGYKIGATAIKERPSDCWKHTYLPIDKPIKLSKGDNSIIFHLDRNLSDDNNRLDYTWKVSVKKYQKIKAEYNGDFSITSSAISKSNNKTVIFEEDSNYDYFRNFSFLLDLVLGLAISTIFTLAIYPAQKYTIHDGSVIAHTISNLNERLALIIISISMIRILHSFFVLAKDVDFMHIEKLNFDSSTFANKMVLYSSRLSLIFVLSAIPVIYHSPQILPDYLDQYDRSSIAAAILIIGQSLMFGALAFWDYHAKIMISKTTHEFNREWRSILTNTFSFWFKMDLAALGSAILLFVILSVDAYLGNRLGGSFFPPLLVLTSAIVFGVTIFDYWKNVAFYSARVRDSASHT